MHVPKGSRPRRSSWPLGLCFYVVAAIAGDSWFASSQSAAQAPASPGPAVTTWAVRVAPGSLCEGSEAFAEALATQIPRGQRAPAAQAELVAEVSIETGGVARIRVFDRVLQAEAGARELPLNTRSCDESAEAVSLVLAVLVEAGRGALTAPPAATTATLPPPPPPPPPPAIPPPKPEPSAPLPSPPRTVRHAWLGPRAGHDLSLAAGLSGGLLRAPAVGGTLGWGIRGADTWPIWLQVTALHRAQSNDFRARVSTLYGGVLGCPFSRKWQHFRARACAGGALGAVHAEGLRLGRNGTNTNPVILLGVELAGYVSLIGPLEFTVIGRGDASLLRTIYYYDGLNQTQPVIYEPTVVSGSLFTGLALRFR